MTHAQRVEDGGLILHLTQGPRHQFFPNPSVSWQTGWLSFAVGLRFKAVI